MCCPLQDPLHLQMRHFAQVCQGHMDQLWLIYIHVFCCRSMCSHHWNHVYFRWKFLQDWKIQHLGWSWLILVRNPLRWSEDQPDQPMSWMTLDVPSEEKVVLNMFKWCWAQVCSGRDAVESLAVILAIQKSAECGRPVAPSDMFLEVTQAGRDWDLETDKLWSRR